MNKLVWVVVGIIVVAGGLYWWSTQNTQAPAGPQAAMGTNGSPDQGNLGQPDNGTQQQPAASPVLSVATNATLGSILTATNGMTVYTYSKDSAGVSTCTSTCAANWPPYTVSSGTNVAAVAGLSGTLSTIARADGSMQVTYNGMPLYFYVKDTKAGDVNGQAVGGVWYVVKS